MKMNHNGGGSAAGSAAGVGVGSIDHRQVNNNNNNTADWQPQQDERKRRQRRRSPIAVLPTVVVDQIAAGEVVQRPVSVVKELIENSLDAEATHIIVQFDGLKKISITDNGKGIPRSDLPLLCIRHATSKLTSVDDFSDLETFGFRGEALASTSMVSRLLTVISRVRVDNDDSSGDDDNNKKNKTVTSAGLAAYLQSYQNGKPTQPKAKPCASKVGTKITIEDLFYNVPHRQRAYSKRESEEYRKIHCIVQDYAVHYPTVGFVCQRTSATKGKHKTLIVDCNTGQIPAVKTLLQSRDSAAAVAKSSSSLLKEPQNGNNDEGRDRQQRHKEMVMEATKQVLSHVLESNLADHLLYMECTQDANDADESPPPSSSLPSLSSSRYKFRYAAQIYFTSPAYNIIKKNGSGNKSINNKQSQGKFILFLNHRLVDLPPLRRALEDVYSNFGNLNRNKNGNNIKPVLVVNLKVPGSQVDVNVHPSKRQVALMFQEDLTTALSQKMRERLEEHGQEFVAQSVVIRNPYADDKKKRKLSSLISNLDNVDSKSDDDDEGAAGKTNYRCDRINAKSSKIDQKNTNKKTEIKSNNNDKRKVAPSKLIRTNNAARAGAIEPYLISTQRLSQQFISSTQDYATRDEASQLWSRSILHVSTCPLSKPSTGTNIDLSQPGAFAIMLKEERCACPTDEARRTVLVKQAVVRPKRVVPTQSKYASIASLRKRVGKQQCSETTQQIRSAFFMGVLSNQRSLIQCGENLVMINHLELAKELFYQLALARFGDNAKAHLGNAGSNGGVDIQTAIAQALQCEDDLLQYDEHYGNVGTSDIYRRGMLQVNDTNNNLAHQATACLIESSTMLEEYFSIRIEFRKSTEESLSSCRINNDDVTGDAILTCLPVLLDGHRPQQHALPIFLLRLATQVDWTKEKNCFHGISREIGNFYAMLPSQSEDLNSYVQHNLFPAFSYLLLPSKDQVRNGYYTNMSKLSTLYKVFERC